MRIEMFGWSSLPRSAEAALRDAVSPKLSVRLSAVSDLVRLSTENTDSKVAEQLLEMARSDESERVREAALMGLADARIPSGLSLAYELAAPVNGGGAVLVLQAALVALGDLAPRGEDQYCQLVLQYVEKSDSPQLRYQALVAAGRLLENEPLSTILIQNMADPDPKFRDLSCRIAEERWFVIPDGDVPRAVELAVESLLGDEIDRMRTLAAIVLAGRGGQRGQACIAEAINGRNRFSEPADEQAAIELCGSLGLHSAIAGLQRRLRRGIFNRSPAFAFSARIALATLQQSGAISEILAGLRATNRFTRTRSAAAAGLARVQQARPILTAMLKTDAKVDRTTVQEALRALDATNHRL